MHGGINKTENEDQEERSEDNNGGIITFELNTHKNTWLNFGLHF